MGFLIAAICLEFIAIIFAIQGEFPAFGGGSIIAIAFFICWRIWQLKKKRKVNSAAYLKNRPSKTSTSNSDSSKKYVFITPTGKKYHYDPSCAGVENCIRMELNEAKSKGYTECSRCQYIYL